MTMLVLHFLLSKNVGILQLQNDKIYVYVYMIKIIYLCDGNVLNINGISN